MSRGVTSDTIAAIATPPGRGGIGVIRISGTSTTRICSAIVGNVPAPRYATLANFQSAVGETIDQGIVLFFPGPHSFTGEDVLELHGHGGPVVMDLLLARIIELGARIALPGEFSERAFLNDKIDLSQAEAIADLIDSVSTLAARSAVKSLQGEFSKRIGSLAELVVNLRMYVEAAIDFPEEEVDFLADERIATALAEIEQQLSGTVAEAGQGALLREGISLVIVGRPNAGKSSLMNALTGTDSSIVTTVAGTTRDVVREYIHVDGIPLRLVDTAGIRVTEDEVEVEGVKRAVAEAGKADQVLVVVDLAEHGTDWETHVENLLGELPRSAGVTVVLNKTDLVADVPVGEIPGAEIVAVSALSGDGVTALKDQIKRIAGFESSGEGTFIARRRHLDALARAVAQVQVARQHLADGAGELVAEELRLAHEALCEITGKFTSDDLLGKIFQSFCIGK